MVSSITNSSPTIYLEAPKKTKKNEPKIFPGILTVDREAFGKEADSVSIIKTIWNSRVNRLVIARKTDTHAIVGYAAYLVNEKEQSIYLMRIAVRAKC
jgi:ribosomal protein S18 acetylase RimI-like enzyme